MKQLFLAGIFFVFGGFSLWAQEPTASKDFDLNAVSKKYSDTWRQIESRRAERLSTLKTQYLAALDEIYQKAMAQGDLDGVLAAKSEKDRILTDVELPAADREAMPDTLKKPRSLYDQSFTRVLQEEKDQLRQLHEKYKKTLETQERKLTTQGRVDEALAVRAEKERISDDLPIEENKPPAIQPPVTPTTPAAEPPPAGAASAYTFYKPGTEPPVPQKDMHKMQLFFASPQSRAAGMIYTLEIGVMTSKDKLDTSKDSHTGWNTKSEIGTVFYKPRIWLTARNKSILVGSKLVIEYFSSNVETSGRQKDCIEIIDLPAIPQGKTVVVDGRGIGLYRYEYEQNYGSAVWKSKRGRDFEGLIVSIYGSEGTAQFQQMTSQTLDKEVSPTLPTEKPCPQDGRPN